MSKSGQFTTPIPPEDNGILTINGVAPNGSGNFTLTSSDGSITINPIVNGEDITVTNPLPALPLSPANGGTGVNNGTKTITLGGNLTTSGAFASTFTMTGATGVTFPTSGTLATVGQLGAYLPLTGGTLTGNLFVNYNSPGASVAVTCQNQSSSADSPAGVELYTSTSATGVSDPYVLFGISASLVTLGLDNSDSDNFKISRAAALGVNDSLTIDVNTGRTTLTNLTVGSVAFPTSVSINNLLYANSANNIVGLATANSGVLITSSGGVPSISSTLPSGIAATNMNLTTPTLGAASATSVNFGASTTNGIIGVTTNNNAASGVVGEYISANVAAGSPVSISNGASVNITSISLTAGDWDVSGNVVWQPTTATVNNIACWVTTVSATQPTPPASGGTTQLAGITLTDRTTLPITQTRFSLSSTTTVYLGAYAAFTGTSVGGYGFIGARRVR